MRSVERIETLTYRLNQISGVPFRELGAYYNRPWKGDTAHNKGWAGNLVDFLVGGDAGNRPEPDLTNLGLEVKTIPIGEGGRVLEPTKVTALNYGDLYRQEFWESNAFHKMRAILFVPVVKLNEEHPDEWFIRHPFLWLPSTRVLDQCKQDYDAVRGLVREGRFDEISSAMPPSGQGLYLHPKPNARNRDERRKFDVGGVERRLPPKAWMMRTSFTKDIVTENLKVDISISAALTEAAAELDEEATRGRLGPDAAQISSERVVEPATPGRTSESADPL